MKQLLLIAFFSGLSSGLFSQNGLRVDAPSNASSFDAKNLNDTWAEFLVQRYVTNTSGRNLYLRWELDATDAPEEWEYRVCDKNASYSLDPDLNANLGSQFIAPFNLAPGETAIFDVDILPRQQAGCGTIRLELNDAANPSAPLATASMNVCINENAAPNTTSESGRNNLRIFPNPAVDFISLPKNALVKQLLISNILGKRVKTIATTVNGRYDISDLPDGIYLVSMIDARRNVLKTVRISKRNPATLTCQTLFTLPC